MDSTTDELLMLRVRDGEVEKLGVLYERHRTPLFNFFIRLTGSFPVSEDLVHENINGGIRMTDVSGAGRVYALNGKVRVRFTENPKADCYFGSLNGNVEVTFRPGLSANARLKTFNGKAYSDFPVSYLAADKPVAKSENGKFIYKSGEFQGVRIGEGGPELKFDAFNGNIRILSQESE